MIRTARNYNSVKAERIEWRSVIFDDLLLRENRAEIREWADQHSMEIYFLRMGYYKPPFGNDIVGFREVEFKSPDEAMLCYLRFA